MGAFDITILPGIEAWRLLGLEAHLLEAVANRQTRPILLLHSIRGRMLSLGRYHLYDGPGERADLHAYRRLTGGRVIGAGEGWFNLALILPSRDALLPPHDVKLSPDQVMNRYVRGMLAGLRALGLECFYPGRDAITVERRELAMCTFETGASGAMLFEVALAVNRGMEEVVHDLEHFDPAGRLPCVMYGPDNATKLVRELDRDIAFNEIADAIARGYAPLLGGGDLRELTPLEDAQAEQRGASMLQRGWLELSAAGDMSGRLASQLGTIEARMRISPEGAIERFGLYGDFIGNSPGVAALASALIGRGADLPSVSEVVMKLFGDGDNFILGIGGISNLVKLIVRAQ